MNQHTKFHMKMGGARERNVHLCFVAHQMVLAYDLMVIAESMNMVDNLANVLRLYQGVAALWSRRRVAAGDYASSTIIPTCK
nr:hypothetical protein [Tanacetum cinerariifolium]